MGPPVAINDNSKPKKETTSHELTGSITSALNDGTCFLVSESSAMMLAFQACDGCKQRTNNDESGATSQTSSSTIGVANRTEEGESNDAANLVHGRDNASPDATVGAIVLGDKPRVLQQVVDQAAVVAVDCAVEEGNQGEEINHNLTPDSKAWVVPSTVPH
ncbi:hypothetical protein NOR_02393 [Metarhizium rileyi]|uniref:Uncharacterized protein n=1 Tax=Metarhizium rileyi (strain RCEF 4871) TaxID=1649241 RepID=A0A167HH34_METRR|nr:hypothetical protein NOR_02393 [Metarhizium rileyi RCEF 4871]